MINGKRVKFLFFVAALFVLSSCGKQIGEDEVLLIGNWKGEKNNLSYIIRLDADGNGRYAYVGNGTSFNAEGRARRRNDILRISTKRLSINQFPVLEGEVYVMEVDGVKYRKFE